MTIGLARSVSAVDDAAAARSYARDMSERTGSLLPPVLALSLLMLLAIPLAASAQSGEQASIRVRTAAGDDGAGVEVSGLGFPGDTTVVLELVTPAGPYPLATVATDGAGSFRDVLTVPDRVFRAALRLDARSASGSSASYDMAAIEAVQTVAVASAAEPAAGGRVSEQPGAASDDAVLVLIAIVLGALATAVLYAYRTFDDERRRPGMGAGDDLIWGGGHERVTPEPTATDEPFWKRPGQEPGEGPAETAAREAPTSA